MAESTEIPGIAPAKLDTLAAQPAFASVMKADAAAAKKAVSAMDNAVDDGKLQLDEGSAKTLTDAIAEARELVQTLYVDVRPKFETPLQLGANPVAQAISARLQEVAVGDESSAVVAIEKLLYVLHAVEEAVQDAADATKDADDEAQQGVTDATRGAS